MLSQSGRPSAGMVVARVLMASVFVVMGGWRLLAAWQGVAIANGTLVFSALELLLGLLLVSGWKLRWTAALAALLMLADALASHPFWTLQGAERGAQLLHFMKNIGFVGGLVLLSIVSGPHRRR
jgi:putative oxidoreductase